MYPFAIAFALLWCVVSCAGADLRTGSAADATLSPSDRKAATPVVRLDLDAARATRIDPDVRAFLEAHAVAAAEGLTRSELAGWRVHIQLMAAAPRGWHAERAAGLRIEFERMNPAEARARFIRSLYYDLEGGYELELAGQERPDRLYAVTEEFVITAPSSLGPERDLRSYAAAEQFDAYFQVSAERTRRFSVQTAQEFPDPERVQREFPRKRAILWRPGERAGRSGIRILTL